MLTGRRSLAIDLAFTLLQACALGADSAVLGGFVADAWFWEFAHWMILANVMLMLCGALFKAVNGTGKIVYFISTPILFLVAVLMLAYLSMYAVQTRRYSQSYIYYVNRDTRGQVLTASNVFNLIGTVVAIIFMVVALVQMSSRNIRPGVRLLLSILLS
jgi:hypothetical protein